MADSRETKRFLNDLSKLLLELHICSPSATTTTTTTALLCTLVVIFIHNNSGCVCATKLLDLPDCCWPSSAQHRSTCQLVESIRRQFNLAPNVRRGNKKIVHLSHSEREIISSTFLAARAVSAASRSKCFSSPSVKEGTMTNVRSHYLNWRHCALFEVSIPVSVWWRRRRQRRRWVAAEALI